MDPILMRAVGRGLQIVAAIGMIVYGIVLSSKKQDSEEKTQKSQKNGRTCIWLGILWIIFVLIRMFI